MFGGYQQQDSQEFLAFLLDGLHEDLNRIIKKPATEKPELPDDKVNDQEAIKKLAEECWDMHKKRNDSVVLDLFAGLYRSILVCPECDKISITFDPFMDLTLPLPVDTHWIHDVIVMPLNDTPKVIKVVLDKHDTIKDLKRYIGEQMDMNPECMHVSDVFQGRHFAHLYDNNILSLKIQRNDRIVVCEYDRPSDQENVYLLPVFQFVGKNKLCEYPFIISMTDDEAKDRHHVETVLTTRAKQIMGTDQEPVSMGFVKPTFHHRGGGLMKVDSTPIVKPFEDRQPVTTVSESGQVKKEDEGDVTMNEVSESGTPEGQEGLARAGLRLNDNNNNDDGNDGDGIRHIEDSSVPIDSASNSENLGTASRNGALADNENKTNGDNNENAGEIDDDDESMDLFSLTKTPESTTQSHTGSPAGGISGGDGQLVYEHEGLAVFWPETIEPVNETRFVNDHANKLVEKSEQEKLKGLELDDCLDLFSKTEVLGEEDLWYCNKCKELRQATKTIELWSVPDIFTIHLKRFSSTRTFADKIGNVVNFPIEGLDMTKRVLGNDGKELIYDLFAVDNHYGGLGGGHYTAYVKNFVDSQWYYFDDSHVTPCEDPSRAVSGAAYLLFYRRRSDKPLGTEELAQLVYKMREENYPCEPESDNLNYNTNQGPRYPFRGPGRILGHSSSDHTGSRGSGSSSGGGIWNSPTTTLNLGPVAGRNDDEEEEEEEAREDEEEVGRKNNSDEDWSPDSSATTPDGLDDVEYMEDVEEDS